MPKRTDIKSILVIGSGPIVIGQACEFDYSGTQAIQSLKEEGYRVLLVNSNPATIMTDPEFSDSVYIEPLTPEFLEEIIKTEKPDAILPTMGGQTALNLAMELHRLGILKKYSVQLLGATPEAIERAENREMFRKTMDAIGVESAKSEIAHSIKDADRILEKMGLPLILRPSFTLGGQGGGTAFTQEEFKEKLAYALDQSPTHEVLVEESLLGWKEFELEVVRDHRDNVIIVCSIENFDPMGIHTGDSITVAPAQTLTDREYQNLRNQSIKIIRAIGVETGGSNIQFAVHPKTGRVIVIEMNPRVSRSSALASKATGFPIARVAAKLAVGYTLDELTNDITGTTPCSFEPAIDYIVTKIPRFDFEKFRPTPPYLGTQMKSVGEVMAFGRTFEESLGKALSSLERAQTIEPLEDTAPLEAIDWENIKKPYAYRLRVIADAFRKGASVSEIYKHSFIDPWFLERFKSYLDLEPLMKTKAFPFEREFFKHLKEKGFTDKAISVVMNLPEDDIRKGRQAAGITPAYLSVDTCAGEFEARTPYLYSSYRGTDESRISNRNKIMVLGSGPNRIGQGIEFDYCCVHAALALREMGVETLMVNSNPETVSTDYNISDKLYFEPLTTEHVLEIAHKEKPLGVVVQFGGQTPLKLAHSLEKAGLRIIGTSAEAIDIAEDRERFEKLIHELEPLGLEQPSATLARNRDEALAGAQKLGYPVLVRPSYVLGGRAMRLIYNEKALSHWVDEALEVSGKHPILIDRFLHKATEVDVDAISDGKETYIAGLMEHIEEAGIHSGDSACSLPAASLSQSVCERMRTYTREIARRLHVVGLINIQYAVQGDRIFVLEVNPRASRTVPFISKATGIPIAKLALKVMMGRSLHNLGIKQDFDINLNNFNVKVPVFPFHKFSDVDILLGPEMKSTGEVMGRGSTFSSAYAKALLAAGTRLPTTGAVFMSIRDDDKAEILPLAIEFKKMGFELWATHGTARFLNGYQLDVKPVNKVREGSYHCVDAILGGRFALIINTTSEEKAIKDSFSIRRAALERRIPYSTVLASARAMVGAIQSLKSGSSPEIGALPKNSA